MRRAFVMKLSAETNPAEGRFDGWIEEVDTGVEVRFHSTSQLLDFLGQCVERIERDVPRHQQSRSTRIRKNSPGE